MAMMFESMESECTEWGKLEEIAEIGVSVSYSSKVVSGFVPKFKKDPQKIMEW